VSAVLGSCEVETMALETTEAGFSTPTKTAEPLQPFSPFLPGMREDPHAVYRRYRAADPVHRPAPGAPWFVFRHADAAACLRDPRLLNAARQTAAAPAEHPLAPLFQILKRSILFIDPPDHTRQRGLIKKAFALHQIERSRDFIVATADVLIDRALERGALDLVADYAFPLSVEVIADLLGAEVADRESFGRWSQAILAAIDMKRAADAEAIARAAVGAVEEMSEFIRRQTDTRRRHPQADLLSALVQVEEEGGPLTPEELIPLTMGLLIAGHETTANFLATSVLHLLRHPDQLRLLFEDWSRIEIAMEELLRYGSPVHVLGRTAREDLEVGGRRVAAGETVSIVVASANRDPEVFADPERFDLLRGDRRHLAFGMGLHYCIGAPLARLESEVAIARLFERLPQLALAEETVDWRGTIFVRGPSSLPLRW
jgi:cytochrome P450